MHGIMLGEMCSTMTAFVSGRYSDLEPPAWAFGAVPQTLPGPGGLSA
jgi:hypothetical protein